MYRIVLMMAVLAPKAPHCYVIDSGSELEPSVVTSIMPPTVFRNNMLSVTSKPKGKEMLNYIFDSYATRNKHSHDTLRAPSIDSKFDEELLKDTGATVRMNCTVSALRGRIVGWLRKTDDKLELLTIELNTHTSDKRFRVDLAGDNWQLVIHKAKVEDSGVYCCHVSTHPPLVNRVKLLVRPPEIQMVKEAFLETSETLSLKCNIIYLYPGDTAPIIRWYRGNATVPLDEIRGGVLIETNHFNVSSHLQVDRLKLDDAGNYTCALEAPLKMKAVTRVHVLQGSSLAELQSGVKTTSSYIGLLFASFMFVIFVYDDVR